MLEKKLLQSHKLKNFVALAFALLVLGGSILTSIIEYNTNKSILYTEVQQKLKSAALNIELVLDKKFLTTMMHQSSLSQEKDLKNIQLLSKLANNANVDYVYIMIKKGDKVYFTSSSAKKNEINTKKMTHFLDPYEEATQTLLHILEKQDPTYEIAKDNWGNFLSVFIPKHINETTQYILGADIQIDYIQEQLNKFLLEIIAIKLTIISIITLLGIYFMKISKKEFFEIKHLQEELDKEVDFKTAQLAQLNNELEQRVAQEIEKNRQKEQQLLQQNRLAQMGEMLNMIAHQWRQPLSAINAANNSLIVKAKLGKINEENIMKVSSKITEFTQYLSETINDFRNFFKTDKEKSTTTFDEIVKDALKIVDSSLKYRDIKLNLQLHSTKTFYTYPNELKQVLLNLLKNAEDALEQNNKQNPEITIETQENILIVRDNAGGIEPNIINKVFEPYFSTKQKDGTGLGLYMSKIIVEQHCNGKLSVANNNFGAEFKIELGENNA